MGNPEFYSQNMSMKVVGFFFNLIFENEFGAMLPALDTEALCLFPAWVLLGLTT